MPQPDGPPTPPNPVSALGKATGIGADPKGLSDLQQNMKLGQMPLGPWSGMFPWSGAMSGLRSLLGSGQGAAEAAPALEVVQPTIAPQVNPSSGDVDALTGLLKYNLAKVPNAAPKMVSTGEAMGTSAQGANDMLTPQSLQMMDKMYRQANPAFKALQEQGAFAGPRTTGKF